MRLEDKHYIEDQHKLNFNKKKIKMSTNQMLH